MSKSVVLVTDNASPPPDFVALAGRWCADQSALLLGYVWQAYDALHASMPAAINEMDLERSLTQLLVPRIDQVMSGFEPFYVQHGPYEHETMKSRGQPPQYDLAFVLFADERIMWPMEAKVLETDGVVADYVDDVKTEFLGCRYAPFSSEGAMLGYLLSGNPTNTFAAIAAKVRCRLSAHLEFPLRPHKISEHSRKVEADRLYPKNFRCHHLILEFPELARRTRVSGSSSLKP